MRRAFSAVARRASVIAIVAIAVLAPVAATAAAAPSAGVDFAQRLDVPLPLAATFRDERGVRVRLGDYFGRTPVVVVLGYYGCSNLCTLVFEGLADGLVKAKLHPGHDLSVVIVSIAPLEGPPAAHAKKAEVLAARDRAADAAGWHFLTGDEGSIDAVASAVGFHYRLDAAAHQFAHASGIVVATPAGRTAHYLYGVAFAPAALRSAIGAAQALRATPTRDTWLLCFHYDPRTGRYTLAAMTAVRLVCAAVLALLAGFVVTSRWRERRALRHPTP